MTLQSLYNGNIAGWMWNSRDNTGAMQTRLGSVYRYDQLNRLRVDSVHTWNGTNAWVPGSKWLNYYSYDADGNIKTLYRNDDGGNGLDNLEYHYTITGKPNQLRRVQELMAATVYTGDLENQAETNNYAYDATGNLTQDVSENIQTGGISWTPYNKIDRIVKVTGGTPTMKLAYLYDASGNRVIKDHYATDTSSSPTRTYYVRDAQGNVMGIFKRASGETYAERHETPIYGSSRLGVSYKGALHTAVATDTLAHYNTLYTRELRQRGYELTDHLGNVRATVSDMLLPRGSGVFDAELRTLTDYYPFGMTMPERSYEAAGIDGHRYGYNGKENDNEVKGEGNSLDYGARIYDPRVGRWLSVDPLFVKYPASSPYTAFNNSPVLHDDPTGKSAEVTINRRTQTITVKANMVFYGSAASQSLALQTAADVQRMWNEGAHRVNIDGVSCSVVFEIRETYKPRITEAQISRNSDVKNNYVRVGERIRRGISWFRFGGNDGYFLLSNILTVSTTESHEMGHGWGLWPEPNEQGHPPNHDLRGQGQPGIMAARGFLVDPEFQYDPNAQAGQTGGTLDPEERKVLQSDIDALGLDRLQFDSRGKAKLGRLTNRYQQDESTQPTTTP